MAIQDLVNDILMEAYQHRAADVYIVPSQSEYLIERHHYHQMVSIQTISKATGLKIINYFKYNGNMLISEHRRPQIGAMEWSHLDYRCDLRFSTVGDFKGREALVIRLIYALSDQQTHFFQPEQYFNLKRRTRQRGLIIFAGPTGAGKTTTIYQLAKEYSQTQMVMSIEDPVEVYEPSFLQLQVNSEALMSYQELLKVGLRNRPDIFIIGEIRDQATAQAAVQAALSGHLVLTTIHAKTPLGVMERLTNLGVQLDYLEQCLNAISYQRLLQSQTGQIKGLLNLVTAEDIFVEHVSNQQTMEKWQSELTHLVAKHQITDKERERVWYG